MNSDPRLQDSVRRLESMILDESRELSEIVSEEGLPESGRPSSGVTIFIPNWNHEALLPRALKSALGSVAALNRAGFDAEILVIDDASRDGSLKLLRTIQAMYRVSDLRVVRLRKNYGQARLTNLALQISRFRYVLRLDADNELVPENIPAFLESSIDTGATLLYGNLIRMTADKVAERAPMISNMPATMLLTHGNYIDALAIMDAFEILDAGGYTRVNPYSPEDWEMNLHLISQERLIVFVPLLMGYYHTNEQSASRELSLTDSGTKTIRRIYAHTGTRAWDRKRVGRIYHPRAGFLDEWGY